MNSCRGPDKYSFLNIFKRVTSNLLLTLFIKINQLQIILKCLLYLFVEILLYSLYFKNNCRQFQTA